MSKGTIHLLDYGAGNVRSVRNAIRKLNYHVVDITRPEQLDSSVEKLVFPGVGSFSSCMTALNETGLLKPLKSYLEANRPFLGICLGLQTLFEGSEECPGAVGLGLIKGQVRRFEQSGRLSVPHIGWNGVLPKKPSRLFAVDKDGNLRDWEAETSRVYFVHSFCALSTPETAEWELAMTHYGTDFISAVQKGNIMATQFHPEKSGYLGLGVLNGFLSLQVDPATFKPCANAVALSKRVIACLDVQRDEDGKLIVTKGVGYDIIEGGTAPTDVTNHASPAANGTPRPPKVPREGKEENPGEEENPDRTGKIRNCGDPLDLAEKYFHDGCDELTFLSIKSFECDQTDTPLHRLLEQISEKVFVPLTIGGGIRDFINSTTGKKITALEIATTYFRSGADKVSIGSDAVRAVKLLRANKNVPSHNTSIETISTEYGKQAVVISVDPKRRMLETDEAVEKARKEKKTIIDLPDGSRCWYEATTKGGKEASGLDVVDLIKGCEVLGAGEILLNSIGSDGKKNGFDVPFIKKICEVCTLPIIASSGAGSAQHFSDLFRTTTVEAGLAAGMFHSNLVSIVEVKDHLKDADVPAR